MPSRRAAADCSNPDSLPLVQGSDSIESSKEPEEVKLPYLSQSKEVELKDVTDQGQSELFDSS